MKHRNELRRQRVEQRKLDARHLIIARHYCPKSFGEHHIPTGPGPQDPDNSVCHYCGCNIMEFVDPDEPSDFWRVKWLREKMTIVEWL